MNTIIKVIIAVVCAASLMYFDSLDNKKEKTNVGNSHVGNSDRDYRVRIGNLRFHRVCVVSHKQGARRVVKCPVCEFTRTPDNRYMCKKIERIILATQINKRKKYELARTHHQIR